MEVWKPIAEHDGYEVSNIGRIRSFRRKTPHLMKTLFNRHTGYISVNLTVLGLRHHFDVHRFVAKAFIPNPDNKPCVNHINGIKTDNRVENLEWCTRSENATHAFEKGLAPRGEKHYCAKLTNVQVIYIRNNPDGLKQHELAKMFHISISAISLIQRGKRYKDASGEIREECGIPQNIREQICHLYQRGSREFGSTALAKRFGVVPQTVLNIVNESTLGN